MEGDIISADKGLVKASQDIQAVESNILLRLSEQTTIEKGSQRTVKDTKELRENVKSELPVHIQTVPLDKALEINNLRAVFGERYPDPVRVVSIGPTVPELLAARTKGMEAQMARDCGPDELIDVPAARGKAHGLRRLHAGQACWRQPFGGDQRANAAAQSMQPPRSL